MASRNRSISTSSATPFHDAVDHVDGNHMANKSTSSRKELTSESSRSPSVNGRSRSISPSRSGRLSVEVSELAQTSNYNSPNNQLEHEILNHQAPQRQLNFQLEHTLGGSQGHTRAVSAVKFSPDGTRIASCCRSSNYR
jgi:WD40 repeat protein